MATKEQGIVAEPGSSPVSLSVCFVQAYASANPVPIVDLPTAAARNGDRTNNAAIPNGPLVHVLPRQR
jgi:hypothetical protein